MKKQNLASVIGSTAWLVDIELRARCHNERETEHYSFVSLIFFLPRLKSTPALSEAKRIDKTKNAPFHARNGKEPLQLQK